MSKICFVLGATGMDGSYLCEQLLEKGYIVHGLIRRSSSFNTGRLEHIYQEPHVEDRKLILHYGDLLDFPSLNQLLLKIKPDEVYNLAAQSHVQVSFLNPTYTITVNTVGVINVLEAVKNLSTEKLVKYYQASSSEMFGNECSKKTGMQSESTPFHPRSPYGCSKLFGHYQTINYREAYGLFACCGILFNHTGSRRGETFVSRKITRAATRIKLGLQDKLYLGNLGAYRDWGYAPEFTQAMQLILQQPSPEEFVIATGDTHSIQEFCEKAFGLLELDYKDFVVKDKTYLRPAEVDYLYGDATKAKKKLGWIPKTSFDELVELMITSDLELAEKELLWRTSGKTK